MFAVRNVLLFRVQGCKEGLGVLWDSLRRGPSTAPQLCSLAPFCLGFRSASSLDLFSALCSECCHHQSVLCLPSVKNSTLSQSPVHWGCRKPWLKAVGKSPLALSALKTMLSVWKGTKTTEKLSRTYCLCVRFCHCSHISLSSQPQLRAGGQMHAEGTFLLACSGTAAMEAPLSSPESKS